jgi:hypothetical protein
MAIGSPGIGRKLRVVVAGPQDRHPSHSGAEARPQVAIGLADKNSIHRITRLFLLSAEKEKKPWPDKFTY